MAKKKPVQRVNRALLIGVDRYQYIHPPLSGCVGDVEQLAQVLRERLHTPVRQITKLTASHGGGEKNTQLATRANIITAFKKLAKAAKKGEQIYIHYSGHGMRNDYTLLPGLEPDGRDEAIAPTDTGYQDPAEFYLLDKELGWLIRQITDKGAFVTVVLDCCHSASGTRNVPTVMARHGQRRPEDGPGTRAWEGGDPRPRPDGTLVAKLAQLKTVVAAAPGSTGSLLAAPKNYVLLTACREQETAKEYGSNGVFTHFFLKLLQNDPANLTYRGVQDQVGGAISRLASSNSNYGEQTPQLEGDGNLVLFGGGAVAEPNALIATPQADGTILLSGGAAVGMSVGSTVALYAPGAVNLADPKGQIGLATVVKVRSEASTARAAAGVPAKRLVPGMRAVLVRPGNARLRRRVALGKGAGLDELKKAIAQGGRDGKDSPYIQVVAPRDRDELSVVVDKGQYVILDHNDQPLPRITPPLAVSQAGAAQKMVQRLEHLIQYRNAWELHNEDETSGLRGLLAITVDRDAGRAAGRVALQPGEAIRLKIHNRSTRPLNVALLYFAPDWSIKLLWPSGADYTPLEPTGEQGFDTIRQQVSLPPGVKQSVERLKLFASDQPTRYHALLLSSLDVARSAITRAVTRNALEQLLASVGDGSATRDLFSVGSTGDWSTAELELETTA